MVARRPTPKGSHRRASLSDYNTAVRLMRAIRKRVRTEIDAQRPLYTYATVVSIDPVSCSVIVVDDPDNPDDSPYQIQASSGSLPSAVGQMVRVAGQPGDRYLDGVIGACDTGIHFVSKPADTVRISTAVLAADPDLTLTLPVGIYLFDMMLAYDASTTADVAIGLTLPSGASVSWGGNGNSNGTTSANPATVNRILFAGSSGPVLGGVGVGSGTYATPQGLLVVTTPGVFALKWAQNTSDATNTTLHANSYMRAIKVA